MRFLPQTEDDIREMLEAIGLERVDDLFTDVPGELRATARIDLPTGLSEPELRRYLAERAEKNTAATLPCFLGAGSYPHFVPAVVDQILQRAEFYSAYTPYQPEVSQGTLQAIFEFQTMVSLLLGLEVANASMYDGASGLAEAVLMALRVRSKRPRVILSRAIHPQYREVVRTYLTGAGDMEIVEAPLDARGGTDLDWLRANVDDRTAAVAVGYPNVLGIIEDLGTVADIAHERGALCLSATAESLALGLLRSPGELGVDIAVAEGQSLGIPMSYGGPGLGLFATRPEFLRMMPGRLVGEATDSGGRRGYVLTLSTREQHIRREKATSNICTNQGLMSLAFTVHVSLLGRQGLRELATANTLAAHEVSASLQAAGFETAFPGPFFNEFVVRKADAEARWEQARESGVIAGWPLSRWYPEFANHLLLCVTEMHDDGARAALGKALTR